MLIDGIKAKETKCMIFTSESAKTLQDEINKWFESQSENATIYNVDYHTVSAKAQFGTIEYSAFITYCLI